ncbi:MAG TPA: RraA family protein [Bryobacteraceae bacterium]|nr:RraA family protein [Bryobacteraceae bacterium]
MNSGELLEFLRTIDTPTVANAIEAFQLRSRAEGFPSAAVRCLFPELGVMCGYAVTAQVETVSNVNPLMEAEFVNLFAAVEQSPKPAVVVMQDIGSEPERAAHSGEVMCTIFSTLGAIGVVTDSAVRDLCAVRKLGFHYFARGTVSSHAHFRIVRSSVPVHVHGMTVRPGDLLHGDENGVVSIPEGCLEKLPEAIQTVLDKEQKLLEFVRQPGFTSSMLRNRFLH